jgi:hypothetical protein
MMIVLELLCDFDSMVELRDLDPGVDCMGV